MTPQPRRPDGTSIEACTWCFREAIPAKGVYLEQVARGRTMCSGCGRFQVFCTCSQASRARAKGYNGWVGSSGESNTIANDARVLATTHDAGVTASTEVVAR